VDEVALVGNREESRTGFKAWKASPVKTMLIGTAISTRCARWRKFAL